MGTEIRLVYMGSKPGRRESFGGIDGLSELEACDCEAKGFCQYICADIGDGKLYPLVFYDLGSLESSLAVLGREGVDFVGDPGMIVVSEVTPEVMQRAVEYVAKCDFFNYVTPLTPEEVKEFNEGTTDGWPPFRKRARRRNS